MAWEVRWEKRAFKRLEALDPATQRRVASFLRERIATPEDPRRLGDQLTGTLSEFWRYRVGDYRILCRIEDERVVVLVVSVGHRREVYRKGGA